VNGNLLLSDNLAGVEKLIPSANTGPAASRSRREISVHRLRTRIDLRQGTGRPPEVTIFSDINLNGLYGDDATATNGRTTFLAYKAGYRGGVQVAYTRFSSANVGQSGELAVAPGGGHLPVEVFKSTTNTGEIKAGDDPLATFFPFGFTYTKPQFVAFGGNET
jgi:hypothetical protein